MRAAQLKDGVVVNVIEVESFNSFPDLVDANGANIGDTYNGKHFEPKIEPPKHEDVVADIPKEIEKLKSSIGDIQQRIITLEEKIK